MPAGVAIPAKVTAFPDGIDDPLAASEHAAKVVPVFIRDDAAAAEAPAVGAILLAFMTEPFQIARAVDGVDNPLAGSENKLVVAPVAGADDFRLSVVVPIR